MTFMPTTSPKTLPSTQTSHPRAAVKTYPFHLPSQIQIHQSPERDNGLIITQWSKYILQRKRPTEILASKQKVTLTGKHNPHLRPQADSHGTGEQTFQQILGAKISFQTCHPLQPAHKTLPRLSHPHVNHTWLCGAAQRSGILCFRAIAVPKTEILTTRASGNG